MVQQRLEYKNEVGSGYVVYKDQQGEIKFFFEFGGGNCIAIIYVPTENEWAIKTKRSVIDRQQILSYVANQVIKDQAPNCYYKLSDHWIEIFTKEI